MLGETVTVEWQQTQQNFVLAEGSAPAGANRTGTVGVGYLGETVTLSVATDPTPFRVASG